MLLRLMFLRNKRVCFELVSQVEQESQRPQEQAVAHELIDKILGEEEAGEDGMEACVASCVAYKWPARMATRTKGTTRTRGERRREARKLCSLRLVAQH